MPKHRKLALGERKPAIVHFNADGKATRLGKPLTYCSVYEIDSVDWTRDKSRVTCRNCKRYL